MARFIRCHCFFCLDSQNGPRTSVWGF